MIAAAACLGVSALLVGYAALQAGHAANAMTNPTETVPFNPPPVGPGEPGGGPWNFHGNQRAIAVVAAVIASIVTGLLNGVNENGEPLPRVAHNGK